MSAWQPRPRPRGMAERVHLIRKKLNEMSHFGQEIVYFVSILREQRTKFRISFTVLAESSTKLAKKLIEIPNFVQYSPHFVQPFRKKWTKCGISFSILAKP
jgi:hypothetical protein